jgi:nicotinamidase-related amidase
MNVGLVAGATPNQHSRPVAKGRDELVTSALLVMDVQQGVVDRLGQPALIDRVAEALTAARNAAVPVIFVRVAFRPGFPEVSKANLRFSALAGTAGDGFGEQSPATQICPAITPRPAEPVVVKKRVSAFTGSDLDVLLRSLQVGHLVLTGIATSGVVLSTLREAADRDYELTVLADCCADADEEVHRVLLDKVFPRQATVTTTGDWVTSLAAPAPAAVLPATP